MIIINQAHVMRCYVMIILSNDSTGLSGHEVPGKVVIARPPKRLAQLRIVSRALVSTLPKNRSKTSKLIGLRLGSLHFRDNWEAVCMWLIYSNRKSYPKSDLFLPRHCHYTTTFFVIDTIWPASLNKSSTHICIKESYVYTLSQIKTYTV